MLVTGGGAAIQAALLMLAQIVSPILTPRVDIIVHRDVSLWTSSHKLSRRRPTLV